MLKHFSEWPHRKYDLLREASALMAEMKQMRTDAKSEEKWGEKQIRKEGYVAVKRRAEYELGKLLEPYRSVTADQFQPEAS